MAKNSLEERLESCLMDFNTNPPLDDGLLLSKTKVLALIQEETESVIPKKQPFVERSGWNDCIDQIRKNLESK